MNSNSHFSKYAIGFLLGAVGVPLLKSRVAQKAYVYLTAGAFIARDSVMEEVERIQATAMDISEDAKVITEKYYAQKDQEFAEVQEEA